MRASARVVVCVRRARSYGLGTRVARGVHRKRLYAARDARLLHFRRSTSRKHPRGCKGASDQKALWIYALIDVFTISHYSLRARLHFHTCSLIVSVSSHVDTKGSLNFYCLVDLNTFICFFVTTTIWDSNFPLNWVSDHFNLS